jgi:hypothetical protein
MASELKACPFCGLAPSRAAKSYGTPIVCCGNVHCTLGASDADWYEIDDWNQRPIEDAATARAEAAEQRAEAAEREVARLRGAWAQAEAAAHFCQSVAHLLASPGAEAEAVQHLRADDLPHLLDCLRGRIMLSAPEPRWVRLRNEADLVAEAQPAEVADG